MFTRGVTFPYFQLLLIPPRAPLLRDHTPSPIGASRGKHYYPPIHTFITPQSSWAVPSSVRGIIKKTTLVILYKHNFAEVSIPIEEELNFNNRI